MIRPHVPLTTRFVDYGKVFVPNGALDFSVLASSDAEVARFGMQLFNRGLLFPETSPFAGQIGEVSAALLMFEGGYLFTLVQRRREGELSAPGSARTDRPFNQVRFVILTREMIEQAFGALAGLYTGLAIGARDEAARGWLKDYTTGGEQQTWSPRPERLDPKAPDPEAVRFVTNAVVTAAQAAADQSAPGKPARPQPISVPLPGQDLLEKLQLVEAVQYWVLPRLGVITFALDYVSVQNVHLRLFPLPPDAPAPLPPDRVFVPGPTAGRFADDYYTALSEVAHEELYDSRLPSLLELRMPTAQAVSLLKVEKQAEALPGGEALRLYPELARLGERRFNLLRRVPRDESLELLRRPDLPADLRLDLLQIAWQAANGMLGPYSAAHLSVPRPARDDERVRALLREALSKSPEPSLGLGTPDEQAELYRDLLLARRASAPGKRGQAAPVAPLALATGQPLLEALILGRRGPALEAAVCEVSPTDAALFGEALAALDRATDLEGLLWLWQRAGGDDFKKYCTLLERAVRPAWYAALARHAGAWRELLAEGRALALKAPGAQAAGAERRGSAPSLQPEAGAQAAGDGADVGRLLRALPAALVPFVWQAGLATAEHDAAFAEWWLFNEALALPEQLPALWQALQRLPAASLIDAGPQLNALLGRSEGLSLLEACTPPGQAAANEALYATVLQGWLAAGFRSQVGHLALAAADIEFLITHLPGSNDVLAAIAASPAQAAAIRGIAPDAALHWAQAASGPRREAYRADGKDCLFPRLIDLPGPDEPLLWHLLAEDDGTAPGATSWSDYRALVVASRAQIDRLKFPAESRLRAYLDLAGAVQSHEVAATFGQNRLDLRRVFALLATQRADPASAPDLRESLLPLAVFHLQETGSDLKERAAELLRRGLLQADIQTYLHEFPDNVLAYLRQNFCEGQPALVGTGHWIDAELSRRSNAYRLEAPAKVAAARPAASRPQPAKAAPNLAAPNGALPAGATPTAAGQLPPAQRSPAEAAARPVGPVPAPTNDSSASAPAMPAASVALAPVLGEVVLPGAAPKRPDSAIWLWVIIIVIVLLILGVLIGALVWLQHLPPAGALLYVRWGLVAGGGANASTFTSS